MKTCRCFSTLVADGTPFCQECGYQPSHCRCDHTTTNCFDAALVRAKNRLTAAQAARDAAHKTAVLAAKTWGQALTEWMVLDAEKINFL